MVPLSSSLAEPTLSLFLLAIRELGKWDIVGGASKVSERFNLQQTKLYTTRVVEDEIFHKLWKLHPL